MAVHTPLGLRRVTRVMPGTCLRPSLPIALRAFFSFRLWTATAEPAGIEASPSPAPSSFSESDESEASSAVVFLVGSSSGSSSTRGFDILRNGTVQVYWRKRVSLKCSVSRRLQPSSTPQSSLPQSREAFANPAIVLQIYLLVLKRPLVKLSWLYVPRVVRRMRGCDAMNFGVVQRLCAVWRPRPLYKILARSILHFVMAAGAFET